MGAELAQSPFSGDSGGQAAARPELSLNSTVRIASACLHLPFAHWCPQGSRCTVQLVTCTATKDEERRRQPGGRCDKLWISYHPASPAV